jgi:hypothetical protein
VGCAEGRVGFAGGGDELPHADATSTNTESKDEARVNTPGT